MLLFSIIIVLAITVPATIQLTLGYHRRVQKREDEIAELTRRIIDEASNINRRIDDEITELHNRIDAVRRELIKENAAIIKSVKSR